MDNLKFSQSLKEQRRIIGKTQEEMAAILHIRRTTYGEYERGNILPPVDKLAIIAKVFGVSVDYLLGYDEYIDPQRIYNDSGVKFTKKEMEELADYARYILYKRKGMK